jgi:hypothetical protein
MLMESIIQDIVDKIQQSRQVIVCSGSSHVPLKSDEKEIVIQALRYYKDAITDAKERAAYYQSIPE